MGTRNEDMRPIWLTACAMLAACTTNDPDKTVLGTKAPRSHLAVHTIPAGAFVIAHYGNDVSDIRERSCISPCVITIPRRMEFSMSIRKDGYAATQPSDWPALGWRWNFLAGDYAITPNEVTVTLRPLK